MNMLKGICKCFLLATACLLLVFFAIYYFKSIMDFKMSSSSWEYSNVRGVTVGMSDREQEDRPLEIRNVTAQNESCKSIFFPRQVTSESLWMPVCLDRLVFVYSAYHINRNYDAIIIIGTKKTSLVRTICQLWYGHGNSEEMYMKEVVASSKSLPESHGKIYSAAFFECKIGSDIIPKYVSIVTTSCDVPKNLLTVRSATNPPKYTQNFTVCLSPLNLHYSKPFELVEWIELNTILGADKFIVYNHSIANTVARVLEYYSKRGVVKVLPWNIPLSVPFFPKENKTSEIHYFGQVAAINDCLYRNKHLSEFVVNVDADEFIVPQSTNLQTWYDIINMKQQRKSAYIFRNTFFKLEWEGNATKTMMKNQLLMEKYKLVTLQKLQHEKKIFAPKKRSKYFARTSDVFQLMIHEVPRVVSENVPADIALLHHYRQWGGKSDHEDMKVFDDTVPAKYGDKLISSVVKTWTNMEKGSTKL